MGSYQVLSFESVNRAWKSQRSKHQRSACENCRQRKQACDGAKPCSRCRAVSADCQYTYITRVPPKRKAAPTPSPHEPLAAAAATADRANVPPRSNSTDADSFTGKAEVRRQLERTLADLLDRIAKVTQVVGAVVHRSQPALAGPAPPSDIGDWDALVAAGLRFLQCFPSVRGVYDDLNLALSCKPLVPQPLLLLLSPPPNSGLLRVDEDHMYNPDFMVKLIYAFVSSQPQYFAQQYFDRTIRKWRRGEVSPLQLNTMLAIGASYLKIVCETDPGPDSPSDPGLIAFLETIREQYLKKCIEHSFEDMADPTVETPLNLRELGHAFHIASHGKDGHYHYHGLSVRYAVELGFHCVDLPPCERATRPPLPKTQYHDPWADRDPLRVEFIRRGFWALAFMDGYVSAVTSMHGMVDEDDIHVEGIDDRVLQQLFDLDPDKDTYPLFIPGISGHLMGGYPTMLPFFRCIFRIVQMRAKYAMDPHTPTAQDYPMHKRINHSLQGWFSQLPVTFRQPTMPRSHEDLIRNAPFYVSTYVLVSIYHVMAMMANLPSARFEDLKKAEFVREESCRQYYLDAIMTHSRVVLPFMKMLPPKLLSIWICVSCFLVAMNHLFALAEFPPSQRPILLGYVRDYINILSSVQLSDFQYIVMLLRMMLSRVMEDDDATPPSTVNASSSDCSASNTLDKSEESIASVSVHADATERRQSENSGGSKAPQ